MRAALIRRTVAVALMASLIFSLLPFAVAQAQAKTPSLLITSPRNGSTVTGAEVQIKFKVANFKLDSKSIGRVNKAGAGHILVSVNGVETTRTASTSIKVAGFGPGESSVTAELVNNDRSPLSPPVQVTLAFTY